MTVGALNSIPTHVNNYDESNCDATNPEGSFVFENSSDPETKEKPSKKRKANKRNLS